MFSIHAMDKAGRQRTFGYDQHTSRLTDERGDLVVQPGSPIHTMSGVSPPGAWPVPLGPLTPDEPGRKSAAPRRLKIQLGLGCNYGCSYCLQGQQKGTAEKTSTRDAEIFLAQLDRWLDPSSLTRIEFWGGEPLLYWHKIEVLAPALRARFPQAEFGTVTNGSREGDKPLMTRERLDRMREWGFHFAISHDGPGQGIRGPDPLDDPEVLDLWRYAADTFGHRLSINAVLTPVSSDPVAVTTWLRKRLDRPELVVSFEGVVHEYNEGDPTSRFSPAQLAELTSRVVDGVMTGALTKVPAFQRKVRDCMNSILRQRPSSVLGQKCGMDREDQLAVDLLGNVGTCQNVSTKGPHRIGHVMAMDKVRLNTSWRWSARKECPTCPVLQLCQGACMYQTGDGWVSSCNAEFAYNMAFLIVAVQLLTGTRVVSLDGPALRPQYA
ncbi:radical SAM/SPASM domain-containing protein [Phreatobacter stygius]|uniref:Radical SAM protein n=1 Tax=Phreatobacter stygius TaxID=1940610 RepID=A0A4D7BBZ3_9HYPH|nr:radical SAM protein [Phreatobacter stygius]QCI65527.1 radical SAM protein [Phreatobacter stygius]